MRKLTILFILTFFIIPVFPWGSTGHRTTGYIANLYLNKKARAELQRVLNGQSLAMATTWMDEIRSDSTYPNMADWHWVEIPDGQNYESSEKNPKGDLIQTIERLISELKTKSVSGQKETEHVKMLIHLIGDVHMPLHVGTGTDRGGNQIKVLWFKTETNLHSVWDDEMINDTNLSYTELAESLDKPDVKQIKEWQNSTLKDWAMESMKYRTQAYAFEGNRLGYQYSYQNMPLIRLRLLQAGIRMASVLNDIYGK